MNIRVTYTVHAATLAEAIALAEARLAAFAPDGPSSAWQITLDARPVLGRDDEWRVSVEAVRGTRYGPGTFPEQRARTGEFIQQAIEDHQP